MTKPLLEFERGKDVNPMRQWDDFKKEAVTLLLKKNDTLYWESPDAHFGGRFQTGEILSWFDESYSTDLNMMKVYPFKKEGLRFEYELSTDDPRNPFKSKLRIIKACKNGFIRDWKRNGVCVKEIYTEEKWEPHEPISHPEGYTLQELRS